ncbi:related to inner mitochondrial membrane peptidase 2 [Ustilago trichophora]|uniref:Mitochondrial inner membrane protease subunit 2 n=1 Tax=Ustilago trichophora TaxID=86804 RepID=A0A5C3E0A4_9BASI|nr:related to inner mitochondrial membrane peptidase 2 [Ustilago trichophora]
MRPISGIRSGVSTLAAATVKGSLTRRLLSSSTSRLSTSTDSPNSDGAPSSSSSSSSSKYAGFSADPNFPHPSSPRRNQRRSTLSRTLFALGWIPVAAFITSHLYSLGNVTGGSMSPTFNGPYPVASAANAPSDVVLLNRTVKVKHQELKAGDIVTLISPLDPRMLLTKRIIALPGDTVRVWVPGSHPAKGGSEVTAGRWTRLKIPPGHVWIEGDAAVSIVPGSLERIANSPQTSAASLRNKSRDSREFGPVPMGLITSRIEYILWPPKRFGTPAPRPVASNVQGSQSTSGSRATYPQSTLNEDRTTQVNPSLARILDEMTQMAPKARSKAHPEDSVISPYVDWADPDAHEDEDAAGEKRDLDEQEKLRKTAWNGLSRGGRLGDDSD